MIGAIVGDVAGSRFEFANHRSKEFELLADECFATDDTVMTLAVAKALLECKADRSDLSQKAVECMQAMGRRYPDAGYGGRFRRWLLQDDPQPYDSWGNGAAMRVSPVCYAAASLDEALTLCDAVTAVTHNHAEGIKGARATVSAMWLARVGKPREAIKAHIEEHYYKLGFTLDEIRPTYRFNESCQDTVPQALQAFFEAESFEDAIRCAVSIGGDSDTLAAITGSVAECYWGVPVDIMQRTRHFLAPYQLLILDEFDARYPARSLA